MTNFLKVQYRYNKMSKLIESSYSKLADFVFTLLD